MAKWTLTIGCAATALALAWGAAAQGGDGPEMEDSAVDFADALENAELVNAYTDGDGVDWEEYLDEAQRLHWVQKADLLDEEALAAMEEAAAGGGTDDIWFLMGPYYLKIWNPSLQSWYEADDEILYWASCGDYCSVYRVIVASYPQNVEHIRALADSKSDYGDADDDWWGQYYDSGWHSSYEWKDYFSSTYWYYIEEEDLDVDFSSSNYYVVRWRYYTGEVLRELRIRWYLRA